MPPNQHYPDNAQLETNAAGQLTSITITARWADPSDPTHKQKQDGRHKTFGTTINNNSRGIMEGLSDT